MSAQLLIVKRLFLEAKNFAEQTDPIAAGIATSLLQDAVELYLWTLIKERNIQVKDNDGFLTYLQRLEEHGSPVPYKARLLELNKARVNFKHYGNLPAPAEAVKHLHYVEDFLREAMKNDFAINLDELSLADLITDPDIQQCLRDAEHHLKADSFSEAAGELAKARNLAFKKMGRFMPTVDSKLDDADRAFDEISHARGQRPFRYVREYLGTLREAALVAMLNLSLEDYGFLVGGLPVAHQAMAGNWSVVHRRSNYTETDCRKAITCLVNLCLRLQSRP